MKRIGVLPHCMHVYLCVVLGYPHKHSSSPINSH